MPSDPSPSSHLSRAKSTFLTSQIRLLSQPVHAPSSSSTALPEPTLAKIVTATNKKITSYNRLHFGLESQRHVVEQIDGVYWRDVLSAGLPVRKAETCVKGDVDFTETGSSAGLPELWEDVVFEGGSRKRRRLGSHRREQSDAEAQTPAESGAQRDDGEEVDDAVQQDGEEGDRQAQRYNDLREELQAQTVRRDKLRKRLGQYKKLQSLLTPFEKPQEDIQPNLVTRDNKELEAELAKMRVLLARVGSKIQGQQHGAQDQEGRRRNEDVMSDTTRLEAVLGLG
ncbi:hypothetical protein PMZ80_003174 [Knufia obscura]|uniref:Kinetochore protein fta4 n=2 Tax=Knufia TaxID=430999 RepID=A0AAN8EPG1_9EURO|nr:hypothetical protein PMZ80_003174 [Knufia obscura]KAK5949288.1 hypothetical protein OHC33_009641 [Knufia fluminis]